MTRLLLCIVCLSLSALIAVAGGAAKFDGSWTATSVNSDGKKIPDDAIAKVMMITVFKDGKYTQTVMGKEAETGTYKLDAKKKPATVDMVATSGEDKGKNQFGIYKLEGDKLTIAIGKAGSKDRPKDFEGGDDIGVVVMKRNK